MRTTLDIDDELMTNLLEQYPGKSKTQAIEQAIREHLYQTAAKELIAMAGTIDIDEDYLREMKEADLKRQQKLDQLWLS